jgi:hypothetical protein
MAVTTAAVVGIGTAVASTAKSFSEASKQKRLMEDANKEASKLMADARKRAEKDSFEGLTVPTEAYEAAFETTLAANQQQVEALQEGDARALAAGVGRVGANTEAAAEKTRQEMGQDLFNVQKFKAQSKENIKQQLMAFDVAGSKDAKLRAAQAEEAAAKATKEGIAGIGKSMTAIGSAAPLFGGGDLDLEIAEGSVLPEDELDESKMSLIDERYEGGGFNLLEILGLGKRR